MNGLNFVETHLFKKTLSLMLREWPIVCLIPLMVLSWNHDTNSTSKRKLRFWDFKPKANDSSCKITFFHIHISKSRFNLFIIYANEIIKHLQLILWKILYELRIIVIEYNLILMSIFAKNYVLSVVTSLDYVRIDVENDTWVLCK